MRTISLSQKVFIVAMLLVFSACVASARSGRHGTSVLSDEESVPVFLARGDYGASVLALKERLRTLGYDVGLGGACYDLATARAIRAFQGDAGLYADGICASSLRDTIEYAYRAATLSEDAVLPVTDASEAWEDLRMTLIAASLARFAAAHPEDSDLATLTAYAEVLLSRAVSPLFSDSVVSLCAQSLCGGCTTETKAALWEDEVMAARCRRAAQDALRYTEGAFSLSGGALYITHKSALSEAVALAPEEVFYTSKSLVFTPYDPMASAGG